MYSRGLFRNTGARLATFNGTSFSKKEAIGFTMKGFVCLRPNKVACCICGEAFNDHWFTDGTLGPLVRIRRYCMQESGEEVAELCVG